MMNEEFKKNKKNSIKNKKKKFGTKNMGLDVDKNEYFEIILSNSNRPDLTYSSKNYYD